MRMFIAILCALVSLTGCSLFVSGNGSEITNGICVASGKPFAGAVVRAYPVNYYPIGWSQPADSAIVNTTTDSSGHFSLKLQDSPYNLVITTRDSLLGAFIESITADSLLDTIKLDTTVNIRGKITNDSGHGLVSIKGTPFVTNLYHNTFDFERIPFANYKYTVEIFPEVPISCPQNGPCPSDTSHIVHPDQFIIETAVSKTYP